MRSAAELVCHNYNTIGRGNATHWRQIGAWNQSEQPAPVGSLAPTSDNYWGPLTSMGPGGWP